MPNEEMPQIFGFHPNADISKNIQLTKTLTEMLLSIGDVDGAKRELNDDDEDFIHGIDGDGPNSHRRLNKVKTIMARAKDEAKKPEDEQLSNTLSEIADTLPKKLVDMDEV